MKADKKILTAFLINFFFAIIEFVGGAITGSIAIVSDAIHDAGDALSIGMSFLFEKVSHKKPDKKYTYGYYRYSVLGSVIQSAILLCGSFLVIYNAVMRFLNPQPVDYSGMIVIAVIGFAVNFFAAYFTAGEGSLNQKAINLHMLEDVLGWAVVLVGAVVMRFTDWWFLDPALSVILAIFIGTNALKGLKAVLDIFLEKTPNGICVEHLKEELRDVAGVLDIHHLHVWSMDGYKNAATLHVVTEENPAQVKKAVKARFAHEGIVHVTVECETPDESCGDTCCESITAEHHGHHHHHHHHGHHHHHHGH